MVVVRYEKKRKSPIDWNRALEGDARSGWHSLAVTTANLREIKTYRPPHLRVLVSGRTIRLQLYYTAKK